MFAIKRNQIIVTTLVVMIAVAGYLNFTESRLSESKSASAITEEGDLLSALIYDENIVPLADNEEDFFAKTFSFDPVTAEVTEEKDDTGAAIFVNASTIEADTYFVEAKLEREQSRSKQKDILTEMINNANIEGEKKDACASEMLKLQERIESETASETMLKAKGFGEVYVRLDDETVDVVIEKSSLTDAEVAQIEDIITRKTGMPAEKIRISPLKK